MENNDKFGKFMVVVLLILNCLLVIVSVTLVILRYHGILLEVLH